jgi:ribosomal protein L24
MKSTWTKNFLGESAIRESEFSVGDEVTIVDGEKKGAVGTVTGITGDGLEVLLDGDGADIITVDDDAVKLTSYGESLLDESQYKTVTLKDGKVAIFDLDSSSVVFTGTTGDAAKWKAEHTDSVKAPGPVGHNTLEGKETTKITAPITKKHANGYTVDLSGVDTIPGLAKSMFVNYNAVVNHNNGVYHNVGDSAEFHVQESYNEEDGGGEDVLQVGDTVEVTSSDDYNGEKGQITDIKDGGPITVQLYGEGEEVVDFDPSELKISFSANNYADSGDYGKGDMSSVPNMNGAPAGGASTESLIIKEESENSIEQANALNSENLGKPMVNLKGDLVPNSVWLGQATYAYKDGSSDIKIVHHNTFGPQVVMALTMTQFTNLKKLSV